MFASKKLILKLKFDYRKIFFV